MKQLLLGLLLMAAASLFGQQSFKLEIVPAGFGELPPLRAFASAQYDGKWLLIGGQTTGNNGANTANIELVVVDPVFRRVWTATLDDLYFYIDEVAQLAASYSQFYQDGSDLYLVGGYGYSAEAGRYLTFPYLTSIAVDEVIEAVVNGQNDQIGPAFCQFYDEDFALMQGYLTRIDNKYYLIGGVRYFTEEMFRSDRVLEFVIKEDGPDDLALLKTGMYSYEAEADALPTYVSQVFPDLTLGVTLFQNGVTAEGRKLNWLNIYGDGFSRYELPEASAPHYHSAVIPIYDELYNTMHSLFLGGCEDYLCTDLDYFGQPAEVDHFVRFSRGVGGKVVVEKEAMPIVQLDGKEARFFPAESTPRFANGVIKLDELPARRTLLGYLYGGFQTTPAGRKLEEGYLVLTSSQCYAVYLEKEEVTLGMMGEVPGPSSPVASKSNY